MSLSYSQLRCKLIKGYCDYDCKRLLVFTFNQIFLACPNATESAFSIISLIKLPPAEGQIIYGSFVSDNNSNNFVFVLETQGKYFLRTCKIVDNTQFSNEPISRNSKHIYKATAWPQQYPVWIRNIPIHNIDPLRTQSELTYSVIMQEQKELPFFDGKEINYKKMLKNITEGESQLLLAYNNQLVMATLKNSTVLLVKVHSLSRKIHSIDYWSGYYFLLYSGNFLVIYKKDTAGLFKETKAINLDIAEISLYCTITKLKLPALEWSGRLIDVLYKELPREILLVGITRTTTEDAPFIVKYNIYKSVITTAAIIKTSSPISCINYGPYDNGPVMVGLNNGDIIAFKYDTLEILFQLNEEINEKVSWIIYEPGWTLIIGTESSIYTRRLAAGLSHFCARPEKKMKVAIKLI